MGVLSDDSVRINYGDGPFGPYFRGIDPTARTR